ncbi:hypothetical protein HDU91_004953 [Kappamyces sp. JEL0680]|nr:hypothetical protein HDU91_004953 [Kappamyces sp. JEL0680]
MKNRFSSLDTNISAKVQTQNLVGTRLSNIYDINQKTFLFKFARNDVKISLLIEAGIRFHSTAYVRDKASAPSSFNVKLRKHLRSKRLVHFRQINGDRRIDLQFGEGIGSGLTLDDFAFHLIVEFFAAGNIILTDHEYRIMALQRIVNVENETPICVGQVYQLENRIEYTRLDRSQLLNALTAPGAEEEKGEGTPVTPASGKQFKKKTRKKTQNLKTVLRGALGTRYGPTLIDHAIALAGVDGDTQDFGGFLANHGNNSDMDALLAAFSESDDILEAKDPALLAQGYILASVQNETQVSFEEFHPFLPAYFKEGPAQKVLAFKSFDEAVDEFYSKIESQRLLAKAQQAEAHAMKKLEAVKENSQAQIRNFELSQEKKQILAWAIESNLEVVENAIKTICSFVASGMDWGDLEQLVKDEQEAGNPLALTIVGLRLQEGLISLSLPDPAYDIPDDSDSDSDSNDGTTMEGRDRPRVVVDVDIYSTAWQNARSLYDAKKLAIAKGQKTIEATVKAVEVAEKKILSALEKSEKKAPTIVRYRPPFWFEKFLWFLSSENYLVVGGKDAAQSEILVTRYLAKGDFYVHADMEGAASVIVKKADDSMADVVPPTTLLQAWDSKILTSAFWAHHDQVTKLSYAGDSLPPGMFNIKGKKNYLPPVQLVYGIGLLFQVEGDEAIQRHLLERRPWARDGSTAFFGESIESLTNAETNIDDDVLKEAAIGVVEAEQSTDRSDNRPSATETDAAVEHAVAEDAVHDPSSDGDAVEPDRVSVASESPAPSATSSTAPKPSQLTRGKKSKLKKINAKYADQDEEDRQLAMEILGSNKGPQPKGKKAKMQLEKQRQQAERARIEKEKWEARQKEKAAAPRHKPALPQEQEDAAAPHVNLDTLTGQPHDSDPLVACIPVCAPWTVLQKYKYRIKLVPGSLKRGKAAKSAEAAFLSIASKTKAQSELDLMKQIGEPEWINAMIGKVKLLATDKK